MRRDQLRLGVAWHGRRISSWLAFIVALSLVPASPSLGQITYNVTYQDVVNGNGIGFDHATLGATRRDTVNQMFAYLATQFDGRGTANITWNASQIDGTGFLATFGPRGFVGQLGSFQNGAVYNRLRSGNSTFGNPDGEGTMDFGYNWNNTMGPTQSGYYDLYSVALHEALHGHGFLSYTDSAGKGAYDSTLGTPDLYTTYDKFLQRGNVAGTGGLLNTDVTSGNYGAFIGDVSTLTNSNNATTGLFFGGKYASEIYGTAVPLYAPATYAPGSSTSHDETGEGTSEGVMDYNITNGFDRRTLKPYEVGMLIDMGYNNYNWSGNTTGNWSSGSTAGTLASSNWRTDMGITRNAANTTSYNMNSAQSEAPVLAPYGQVTSNIVLNFRGSGSSAYTSTNDLGTFRLSRITLSSNASVTNTIMGGTLIWGQNSDGTSAAMISAIEQMNTGAFNINSTMQIPNGLTVRGSGSGSVSLGGNITGAGGLTKNGSFMLTLNGTNTYTGNNTINGGTLRMADGAASALGANSSAALTINGGVLDVGNSSLATGNFTGAGGTIQGSSGTRTLTIGNGNATGGNFTGVIIDGGGTQSLTKTGTGTLTLSGNNTYTGVTTIAGGTLVATTLANGGSGSGIGAATNVASNVVLNGGSLRYTGPAVNSDRLFSLQTSSTIDASGTGDVSFTNTGAMGFNGGTAAKVLTLTGTRTGNNTLAAVVGDNGGATSLVKSSTGTWVVTGANTYTGGTTIAAGTLGFGNGSLGSSGTVAFTGNGTLRWHSNANDLSSRMTMANGIAVTLNTNGNNVTLASPIGSSSTASLTKSGTGILTVHDDNSYTGATTVAAGTLSFASINDGDAPSGIGASSGAASNLILNGGILRYTGGAVTTTRLFSLQSTSAGNSIQSSGTGPIHFSNTGAIGFVGAGNRPLTLGGTNTGDNTLAASIGNNAPSLTSLTKADGGTWVLTGNNSYTGVTTISGGILKVEALANGDQNSNIGAASNVASNLVLNGGTLMYTGGNVTTNRLFSMQSSSTINASGSGAVSFTNMGAMGFNGGTATKTLTLAGSNAGNNTIAAVIGNNTGATSLTKTGIGTWVLSGANTYNGTTTVSAGTLALSNVGSGLTQTLGAISFDQADGTLDSRQAGSGNVSTTFGTLSRSAGATGNIVSTGGTNGIDNIVNVTGAAGFINKGIFFNGAEFAARSTLDGFVRALDYGGDSSTVAVNTITASNHVKLTTTLANQNSVSLLSLNLSGSGVNWVNNASQTLTVPGLLKSGGGSQSTISGGTLATASNAELVIRTDSVNDALLISSIVNPGSGILTKSGSGTLILSNGANDYTGQTHVNAGTLSIGANVHLGRQSTGATLNLKGGTLQATSTFGLYNGTAGTNNRAVLLTNSAGIDVTSTNSLIIAGGVSGNGSLTKSGTGTLSLMAANTYTGPTSVIAGTLGGTGSIAGALTANGNSTIAPGASPGAFEIGGDFVLGSGSTLAIELSGTNFILNGTEDYDRLKVGGATTLSGLLDVSLFGGYSLGENQYFGILDAVGGRSGLFANYAEGATLFSNSGYDLKITYLGVVDDSGTPLPFGGTDVVLYTAAVPEPGTLGMMTGGIVSLWLMRRRFVTFRES